VATNSVTHVPRPRGSSAEGGGSEAEMKHVKEKKSTGEKKEVTMTMTANTTTPET